jgi:hypothetical protein
MPMDYTRQSVSALFSGPLLHTPQGWVVLAFSAVYFFGALLFGVFDVEPPFALRTPDVVFICISYPFILFLFFVKNGIPSFVPSLSGTAWLSFYALFPVIYLLWRT